MGFLHESLHGVFFPLCLSCRVPLCHHALGGVDGHRDGQLMYVEMHERYRLSSLTRGRHQSRGAATGQWRVLLMPRARGL